MSKKTADTFKWSLLIQLSHQGFAFITSIVLTRLLTPVDFGLVGMIAIFIALGRVIMDGGLGASLIRSKEVDELDYSTIFYVNICLAFLMYLILFLSAPAIASFFEQTQLVGLLRLYGIAILLASFTTVQSIKLNKVLNFKTQFYLLFPSLLISSIIGIGMAWKGYGVWSLVVKELVFSGIASILLWRFSGWLPMRAFSLTKLKVHYSFGVHLLTDNLLRSVFNNAYQVIIGKLFVPAQLGLFTRAKSLGELPNSFLFNAVNRVMFPFLAQINTDDQKLKSNYRRIISTATYLSLPILAFMAVSATPLFLFLFTDKWSGAIPFFQILIIAMIFSPIQSYLLNICKVKGDSRLVLRLSIFNYGLVSLSLLSVYWLGILGLLWSFVLITIMTTVVTGYYSGRLIDYSLTEQFYDIKDALLLSLLAGASTVSVSFLFELSNFNSFVNLVINGLLFCAVYLAGSHLMKHPIYAQGAAYISGKIHN